MPKLLNYLRIDVPFTGILLLLLDEKNRPFHITGFEIVPLIDIPTTTAETRRIAGGNAESLICIKCDLTGNG